MDRDDFSNTTLVGPAVAPILQITHGNEKGKTIRLKPTLRIGRENDNDLILTDPRVSRHHATVKLAEGRWVVQDDGSANGTFVNGKKVGLAHSLKPDDRIQIGDTLLVYQPSRMSEGTGRDTMSMVPARPEQEQSRTPQWGWPYVAGALGLLLVIVAGAVIVFLGSPGGQQASTTPTPSTEVQPLPENFILVYEDDFSNTGSGWDDAFDRFTTKQYGNNRYYIEVTTSNLVAWGLANRDIANFRLQVDATQESGPNNNGYGILFRFQDRDNYYRFDVSGEGYYLLSKFYKGEWTTLVPWTASSALNVGQATNVLMVEAIGPNIRIFANGVELAQAQDNALTHGNFGFFANTFTDPNLVVSFDNIELWAPRGEALAVIPTSTPTRYVPTVQVEETAETIGMVTPSSQDTVVEETPAESATPTTIATAAPVIAETLELTPTVAATPAAALPEYVSRESPLGRDAADLGGRFYFPVFDPETATYNIYSLEPDGSEPQLVVSEASQPTVNADGNRIAYRSWASDDRGLIERGVDGGDEWRFDTYFEAARPKFAPNGQSFIFLSRESGETPAIYHTVDGEPQVLRREGGPIQGQSPAWVTNDKFVYQGCLGTACGLIVSNLDGSFPQQITQDPSDTNPDVSSDGSKVTFMSRRNGSWDIFQVGIDGSGLTRLTTDEGNDGLPIWLPDGRNIAFVSDRDGVWEMWMVNGETGKKQFLFELGGSIDGTVAVDVQNSRGWLEESIAWGP